MSIAPRSACRGVPGASGEGEFGSPDLGSVRGRADDPVGDSVACFDDAELDQPAVLVRPERKRTRAWTRVTTGQ